MSGGKNIVRGLTFTGVYIVLFIVVPLITFTILSNLGQVAGQDINLGMSPLKYQQIIFWVFAFGILISGVAFFGYSSPKQSIRKGVFALIQIILNCLYIWSYKFSGALELELAIVDSSGHAIGEVGINLYLMVMIYLGIYFLTIILKVYDLVDFTVNRKKIRFLRSKGKLKDRKEIEKRIERGEVK
jgi:hypothetical protein